MKFKFQIIPITIVLLLTFLQVHTEHPLHACPSSKATHDKSRICIPPENIGLAHKKVVKYYESGCFEEELNRVVKEAKKKFATPAQHDNQVVVFDIDETLLSEYCNIKSIEFGYIPKLFHKWVMGAEAPAIPVMKDFYRYLLDKGYHIVFITGRQHNEYEATKKNLEKEGFTGYDKLIVRSAQDEKLTAKEYKSRERAKLTEEGYEIVGSVGDQFSDVTGTNVGNPIKIPNYLHFIE